MPAVDDTSFAAAKSRVETALGFVKSLTRAQVDGAEDKVIAWTGGANDRKMKGNERVVGKRRLRFEKPKSASTQATKKPHERHTCAGR
jgi:hypothetical protein